MSPPKNLRVDPNQITRITLSFKRRNLHIAQALRCTGTRTGEAGKVLTYKGSTFHLVKPGVMCVGGDITKNNGAGGESIYGKAFNDESFKTRHTKSGLVSMVNKGPDSNNSQFRISVLFIQDGGIPVSQYPSIPVSSGRKASQAF